MNERMRQINEISDAILDLIDNAEELTRSDLQGCAMALAIRILDMKNDNKPLNGTT